MSSSSAAEAAAAAAASPSNPSSPSTIKAPTPIKAAPKVTTTLDAPRPPSPTASPSSPLLPTSIRFVLALAAVSASQRPPTGAEWNTEQGSADAWLDALLSLLDLSRDVLPSNVEPEDVAIAATERAAWSPEERVRVVKCLIQAALTPTDPSGRDAEPETPSRLWRKRSNTKTAPPTPQVSYSPIARAAAHRTLALIGLDTELLPQVEAELGASLAAALDGAEVDEARNTQRQGWGGTLGRSLATGAGVVVGGVLIGVTGGLAAPAIAALLAPLGVGAVLTTAAAPVVLGTLFGLTGGGLAGWRVHERWRGVDEFAFVEVGAGTRPSQEEVDGLKASGGLVPEEDEEEDPEDAAAREEVEKIRTEVLERLTKLSLEAGTDHGAMTPPTEDGEVAKSTRPTLTATIVVPGMLTVSRTEALSAWRAVCSPRGILPYTARKKPGSTSGSTLGVAADDDSIMSDSLMSPYEPSPYSASDTPTGLKDGRDVYVLRFETGTMLSTGRDIETWVTSKLKTLAATEVVKRTVLGAYYMAVALPLSVYKLSTMTLDNSWVNAQGMAIKAGKLLGEVLAQRVQGERPVVLIGTSVGALTVFHALLHLSTLPSPPLVESAYLISLPSAPTNDEWAAARRVVARRLVNGWSGSDFVLASVVRLHEVVSRAVTGKNGVCVAGLGAVMQPGVEDVDLSEAIAGHFEINASIPEVLEMLQIDE